MRRFTVLAAFALLCYLTLVTCEFPLPRENKRVPHIRQGPSSSTTIILPLHIKVRAEMKFETRSVVGDFLVEYTHTRLTFTLANLTVVGGNFNRILNAACRWIAPKKLGSVDVLLSTRGGLLKKTVRKVLEHFASQALSLTVEVDGTPTSHPQSRPQMRFYESIMKAGGTDARFYSQVDMRGKTKVVLRLAERDAGSNLVDWLGHTGIEFDDEGFRIETTKRSFLSYHYFFPDKVVPFDVVHARADDGDTQNVALQLLDSRTNECATTTVTRGEIWAQIANWNMAVRLLHELPPNIINTIPQTLTEPQAVISDRSLGMCHTGSLALEAFSLAKTSVVDEDTAKFRCRSNVLWSKECTRVEAIRRSHSSSWENVGAARSMITEDALTSLVVALVSYSPWSAKRAGAFFELADLGIKHKTVSLGGTTRHYYSSFDETFEVVEAIDNDATSAFGIVGRSAAADRGPTTWVAFRGSSDPKDWCANINMQLVKPNYMDKDVGMVHAGFLHQWNSVKIRFLTAIDAIVGQDRTNVRSKIIVSGHSLGGAIATIAAMELAHLYPNAEFAIYTAGAPRAGNVDFAAAWRSQFQRSHTARFVNTFDSIIEGQDFVSVVPLTGLGFDHTMVATNIPCAYAKDSGEDTLALPFTCHSLERYLFALRDIYMSKSRE